jgi:hypothetical protein
MSESFAFLHACTVADLHSNFHWLVELLEKHTACVNNILIVLSLVVRKVFVSIKTAKACNSKTQNCIYVIERRLLFRKYFDRDRNAM